MKGQSKDLKYKKQLKTKEDINFLLINLYLPRFDCNQF